MKQIFLKKENNGRLLLFFAGWGSAPELFSEYGIADGYDCLMCYDYKDFVFDWTLLDGYSRVDVAAWSFGVFVADAVCRESGRNSVPWNSAVAFGGTMLPVDETCGIPLAIFEGTLANMSEQVLFRFRRRMCGRDLQHFAGHQPERTLEDMTEELAALGAFSRSGKYAPAGPSRMDSAGSASVRTYGFHWTAAVAGRSDLIFPFANQLRAWSEAGVEILEVDAGHYDVKIFERLLGGEFFEG